jgi:uncharacterized protein
LKSREFRAALLLLLPFCFLFCQSSGHKIESVQPSVVFPDGFMVNTDVAATDQEKALGLMFVSSLEDGKGMLFLNDEESRNPFWMKNCLISLDIIWLDDNGTIVDISPNLQPCKADPCPNYFPSASYKKVLEVRGNLAKEHKLTVGDKLVILGIGPQ